MECIAVWGLRLPTEHRKCHGLIGDYIAAYDFTILITSVGARGNRLQGPRDPSRGYCWHCLIAAPGRAAPASIPADDNPAHACQCAISPIALACLRGS
jgi:hypothetical protein